MTVIVDIDGLTGKTEHTQEIEFEKLDLPAFITWCKPDVKNISTQSETEIPS